MAIDFRCEKCGKLLSVDAQQGDQVKCPHCHKTTVVPAGLASLPQPHLPAAAPPPPPPGASASSPPGEGEEEEEPEASDATMAVLAKVMPWVISLFFHVALALIMLLFAIAIQDQGGLATERAEAPPERRDTKLRRTTPREGNKSLVLKEARQPIPTNKKFWSQQDTPDPIGTGVKGDESMVIGRHGGGSEGGWLAATGPRQIGGAPGEPGLLGERVAAQYAVYVIDRSGSMAAGGKFDVLRAKLTQAIGELDESKEFHLIFFGEQRTPVEFTPRKLVPATPEYKADVAEFIEKKVVPEGKTRVLEALQRAFQVLNQVPAGGEKVIFLLSDGDFEGIGEASNEYAGLQGNEAVKKWIADNNRGRGDVRIYTFLYGGDDPDAKTVMQEIASANGGEFKHVSRDE
jgi:hypothetical protein